MAKATADSAKGMKLFSAGTVAALLASAGTTSLSKDCYELMSSVDGAKTADSFQHSFREVLAQAKELKKRMADGEVFVPVTPKKKRNKASSTSDDEDTPAKKQKVTPVKKQTSPKKKATPKALGKKAASPLDKPTNDLGDEAFPQDANEFIKMERVWEQEFV